MSRHLTTPLITIPLSFLLLVRTAQLRKPPSRTAEAQRRYRHWDTFSSGPDADTQLSREKMLHRERQVQVRTRRSVPSCPPTADLGPNETV
jgi:hypothetical protein